MNLLSKISMKTIGADVEASKEGPIALAHVLGIAKGVKTGQSTYGDWTAFVGSFEAVNLETGEIFRAGKCFLPEIATSLLAGALTDAETVQFALEIGARPAKNAVGYEYTVTPLIGPSESDELSMLKKALPAPEHRGNTLHGLPPVPVEGKNEGRREEDHAVKASRTKK